MFEQLEFSSFILCYGPLILVLAGFIGFATLTDKHARRTYLRDLNPLSDAERPPAVPVVRTQSLTVETPAGFVVTINPEAEAANPPSSPSPPSPPSRPSAPPPPATPVAVLAGDDLRRLEGIGPKIAEILNDAGIMTFEQLAVKSAADLRVILDAAGISQINDPSTWPEQAALAAKGDWDALTKLQDSLKGGRR